ncbi:peptidylprolyl isomerase [Snodgrassella sp. CFCC 13594]|uniref:peptidylprolyl isomerase n=1 Tax=Snodgrassella sp. CFCC 13594 TaxID=1775559 RepID=UPI00083177BE|nr:peptidylprolyl isomerase [Snodgrassella sp. CFCC 13594]
MKQIKQWMGVAAIGMVFQAAQAAGVQSVDSIVAVVNNDAITQQELNWATSQARAQLPKGSKADGAAVRQQALLQLVNQSLLVQAAKRNGVSASEADIDAEVVRIAASKKITVDQLYHQIAKEGVGKNTLRRTIGENILAQKVADSEAMSKGQVTEAEIDDAIARAKQAGKALPPPVTTYTYHVQHILIKDDTEQSRKLTRQIAEQARAGANFEQLARQYSQDGSAANGGDLGWIAEGQTVAPFEAAVKALKPGQVSQPIRSQFGWHVVRLVAVKSNDSPEQQQRNGMRAVLTQEKRAAVMQNLLQQLHQQAFIQVRQ